MLTQYDIDKLMQSIQAGNDTYLYYVAHMIEPREGFLDELIYKSVSRFKVIKIKVTGIQNAFFEYLNYKENPDNYHVEEEECYYDISSKYIHYYITPNGTGNYSKDFNSRMPSMIYGYKRKLYKDGNLYKDIVDPSPIKEVYTNAIEYGDCTPAQALSQLNAGNLDWKYRKLTNGENVDGIIYDYVTSDWYVLDVENFPRTEKPLININQKTAYFMDHESAEFAIQQLQA